MNNRKYHTVGTDPKYNRQIVEEAKNTTLSEQVLNTIDKL